MFGEKLKKLRTDKNMTQQELAKILKISSSTIGMYEQNRRSPDIETLKIIAEYFQCSTDYLLGKNSLGNRIKTLREEKSISQLELAKILHIGNTTLSQYESDKRVPSDVVKKKIAEYFNVSLDYLMGMTDIKNVPNKSIENEDKKDSQLKLSKKDERDIKKDLNKTLEQLEKSQDGLMFDGEPMDEKTRELLRISLENSMRIAKHAAKKYTPKKYRK